MTDHDKLKILTYRWHCGHQYELYKLPYEFTLVKGLTSMTYDWEYKSRPLRPNATLVPLKWTNINKFDLAILHFDENVLTQKYCQGIIPPEWGLLFHYLKSNLKIPMVAICHGTPQFYDQYDFRNERPDMLITVIEEERQRMVDFMGDTLVICNSYQAQREWGFKNSKVIWHGFDPAEYPPALYQKQIITVVEGMRQRPHFHGYYLFQKVTQGIRCDTLSGDMPDTDVKVPEPSCLYFDKNQYAYHKFRNYVDFIRQYSIFFNPTLRSPMPRCRAEAMMCGLAIVSTNNHDADMFIKNGVNGFYGDDADGLREILKYLIKYPARAEQIGREGRKTALKVFDNNRYLNAWQETIEEIIGEKIKKLYTFDYVLHKSKKAEFSVAYVSGQGGDTQRYRCHNMAEYLGMQGIYTCVMDAEEEGLEKKIEGYDIIVFHRVPITDSVKDIIKQGKTNGKKIIFETDDLIFDASLKEYFEKVLKLHESRLIELDFNRYLETIKLCDYVICSTHELYNRFNKLGKNSFIIRNGVSNELIQLSFIASENKQPHGPNIVIGYGSGTPTHNVDFLEAADALIKILQKYHNVSLQIIGYLDIDNRFVAFGDRVTHTPSVSWRTLPFKLREFDINLAPFQNTPFCQCKSELKYFEAALLKIPTVASDIDSYRYAIKNGENGFLADSQDQWYESLEKLVLDPELRINMGNKAYEHVLENYSPDVKAKELLEIFREIISK